ncbi:hypothetical protein TREMEDRAFT_33920 [Tremella mesenterica DSM 1558]|uniref:uncharacterized protein n=1 Tax=Tremella mesenterica (strain ATCC 24925 / CBS 8224 / DSM 1558 / NBRC 9311 / NRRL Y-6157 / RJB 2259-6 / UBC 559-6) TaxID=578456 RepID=UPI0003F49DAA|nr:uncharacterized protein TREMEDRAFT_33920 [Tremella mesenterica DSM 1558]EIW67418.1 hypothetical protein TREMEDRAFT_33920 [Tremella mesenterica DSM 1558]
MAAVMHPSRPSMDRSSSFEHPRPRSSASFYDRPPSPIPRPTTHTRTSSSSSNSHYSQPFPNFYSQTPFNQTWSANPQPNSSFYATPFHGYAHQPVFHQPPGHDFPAWANAYHHMVMASVANGAHPGGVTPPPTTEYHEHERRRTNSGPQQYPNPSLQYSPQSSQFPPGSKMAQSVTAQPFHPYKRGPTHRPSRESMKSNQTANVITSSLPRSVSQPTLPTSFDQRTPSPAPTSTRQDSRNNGNVEPAPRTASPAPSPRVNNQEERRPSVSNANANVVTTTATNNTQDKSTPSSKNPTVRVSTPLHPGPITAATNTPQLRPSPLSQTSLTASAEPEKKGFKGMFKRNLDKDSSRKMSTPPPSTPAVKPTTASQYKALPLTPAGSQPHTKISASPAESSTYSATPPTTPPQELDPPNAPFSYDNVAAMGSELSLAETERTATAQKKEKKSLFRMKNMSTDNISLSSTVSSASMMIRKMGSLGKLARRNSLMGISKIFKDRPKDEDGALPEREVKKEKKGKKKSKGEIVPAAVSRLTAEAEEDKSLAGLSPAAKLARQHTLRSKAEAEKRNQNLPTGEPAWDNNTTTRTSKSSPGTGGPEVLHILPRSKVVQAVAVSGQEYDSDNDSSDGETIEDLTATMGKARLSSTSENERFLALWGNAIIDKGLVPKKGILKVTKSQEDLEAAASRQRSNSATSVPTPLISSSLSRAPVDPTKLAGLDGIGVRFNNQTSTPDRQTYANVVNNTSDRSIYSNVAGNTSAPALNFLPGQGKPITPRSMTAPAKRRLVWAPECAVYSTYDAGTYDRRSEPATCNRLTPELAMSIKQELNAFKLEMDVHPSSRVHTHYFA